MEKEEDRGDMTEKTIQGGAATRGHAKKNRHNYLMWNRASAAIRTIIATGLPFPWASWASALCVETSPLHSKKWTLPCMSGQRDRPAQVQPTHKYRQNKRKSESPQSFNSHTNHFCEFEPAGMGFELSQDCAHFSRIARLALLWILPSDICSPLPPSIGPLQSSLFPFRTF
jgi:hypothetical protein